MLSLYESTEELLVRLLLASPQTFSNQLLGLTLANVTRFLCVNASQQEPVLVFLFHKACQKSDHQLNQARTFENLVITFFQRIRPECQMDSFYTTGTQKNMKCSRRYGLCACWNAMIEGLVFFNFYCSSHEAQLLLEKTMLDAEKEVANERNAETPH